MTASAPRAQDVGSDGEWFARPVSESARALATDLELGLSTEEARRRLREQGDNSITASKGPGAVQRWFGQFHQPLIYILLVAAAVTAALDEWIDAGVILAVVLVNAVIGFVEESRAVTALDALARSMTPEATVLREGDEHRIDARHLVRGDLVLVRSGDKVPADLRLARVRSLRVDESALTGEASPVGKVSDPVDHRAVLGDRSSMAFASTVVTYGQATGVVVATGDDTELGRVSGMLSAVEELQTPLTRKVAQFSRVLLVGILSLAALMFFVGLLRGLDRVETFMASVALTVAAIPEGLPAAMTIMLAIGVGRMAKRRVIIRKLPAVETLGSTTVVCSDKTGTLTANQMTVTRIHAGGQLLEVTGTGYDPDGRISDHLDAHTGTPSAAMETLRCGLLCNDSRLVEYEDDDWRIVGDPTEGALVVAAHKAGLHEEAARKAVPRLDSIPFESEHQYMATLHQWGGAADGAPSRIAYVKGSVERILERCADALGTLGGSEPLDPARRSRTRRRPRIAGAPRARLRPQGAPRRCRGGRPCRHPRGPDVPRSPGDDRPAAAGSDRSGRRVPGGGHLGADDHR